MRTVRRLYFYTLTLIGAEAVVWGVVALLRTILAGGVIGTSGQLATGLSAVLVGLPVFWLHWQTCQRDARGDEEERASRVRAVFLYAIRMAWLIPILYSSLAILDRGIASLMGLNGSQAFLGGSQTLRDNLVAIMILLVAYIFFSNILARDEAAAGPASLLPETRRLYRYLWVALGLTLSVVGVQGVVRYLISLTGGQLGSSGYQLSNALALVLAGAPVWAWTWRLVQNLQSQPVERQSILRLASLYLISLAGLVGVLAAGGNVLSQLCAWLFGRPQTLSGFLLDSSAYLGAGLPLGVVWAYYGRILEEEMGAPGAGLARREGVRRLYRSILSALGVIIVFTAILVLIELFFDLLLASGGAYTAWPQLSTGLAALGVGLPLWLSYWPGLQLEAAARSDAGDRARRSVIRRSYLYLAVFALVVGGMSIAANLFFVLLSRLLGETGGDVLRTSLQRLGEVVVIAAFLVYHLRALRRDGQVKEQSLGSLHAAFPALVLAERGSQLGEAIARELERQAPRLPVKVHELERGLPDEDCLSAKVIVLSAALAVAPSDALRLWLSGCPARRLVLPLPLEGWTWQGVQARPLNETSREAAAAIRQLAEGETPRAGQPASPGAIAGMVLGGVFAFGLLVSLFALVISSLWR